jgi:hypothetical protein
MKDYYEQLNTFVEDETREQTTSYFDKYWLNKEEYIEKWLPIQNKIFDSKAKYFPDMMFNSDFQLIALRGGLIFTEEDFYLLQNCMNQTGDKYFVIVQNCSEENPHQEQPPLRFKYPANVTWDELMSGGLVSLELFQYPFKEYFVFGDTGTWGKYVANDYEKPLDIIGFKKNYSEVFKRNFKQLIEPEIITEWLPDVYKQKLRML